VTNKPKPKTKTKTKPKPGGMIRVSQEAWDLVREVDASGRRMGPWCSQAILDFAKRNPPGPPLKELK